MMAVTGKRVAVIAVCAVVFMLAAIAGMMIGMNQRGYDAQDLLTGSFPDAYPIRDTFSGAYLAGHFALTQQDITKAAQFAVKGIGFIKEQDPQLMRAAMRILIMDGRYTDAQLLAEALSAARQADNMARMLQFNHHALEDEYEEATALTKQMSPHSLPGLISGWLNAWVQVAQIRRGTLDSEGFKAPDEPKQGQSLSVLIHYQRALMFDQLGDVQQAADAYEQSLTLRGDTSARILHQAVLFHNKHATHDAVRALRGVISKAPQEITKSLPALSDTPNISGDAVQTPNEGLAEIYFLLAGIHSSPQLLNDMMAYARLGLQLRPEFSDLQLMLAAAYEDLDDHDKAIHYYALLEKDARLASEARLRKAVNYYSKDDAPKAISELKALMRDDASNREAMNMLGEIYRREKQYQAAVDLYSDWFAQQETPPENYEFYYKRAIALERTGNWQAAEKDLLEALEKEPNQPDVLNYLGYSLLDRNERIDEAAGYVAKAFSQMPTEAHIIDSMGWVAYKQGRFDDAVKLLERALRMVPQDAVINDHLGDAYYRTGRKLEAKWQWQRALTFEPEDPEVIKAKLQTGLPEQQ